MKQSTTDFVPPITPVKLKAGQTMDDRLIVREFYNANEFPVTFTRDKTQDEYISLSSIPIGDETIICMPENWVILPHAFYLASWPDKNRDPREVIAHLNFGKDIGKGVKPNREVTRRARRYVR